MISRWTPIGNMMHFENFDNISGFHVYSLAWRFTDTWSDPWSNRLMAFKAKDAQAIKAACVVMTKAVSSISWLDKKVVMVSAIPSAEVKLPSTHGLYHLGKTISTALKWEWTPDAIIKKPHKTLHTISNAVDRDAEVAGKYSVAHPINAEYVCILDDLITRGATMAEIERAIKAHNKKIIVFGMVLGKNESQAFAQTHGYVINNGHVPAEYTAVWESVCK